MKHFYKAFYLLLSVIVLSLISCGEKMNRYPQNAAFEKFKKVFIETVMKNNPDWALQLGNHDYENIIDVPSRENRERKIRLNKILSDSLKKYDWKKISFENYVDARLMQNYMDYYSWQCYVFKSYEWNPAEYNVGEGFDLILGNTTKTLEGRLRTINDRLLFVPEYYIAAKANIRRPTQEHTALAIIQNQGSLELFLHTIPDSIAASKLQDNERFEITRRLNNAVAGIREYISFLQGLQEQFSKDISSYRSFRIGKKLYEKMFGFEMQSRYTAGEIYRMAVEHKVEIQTEMTKITHQLWKKYFGNNPMPEELAAVKMMIDTLSSLHCSPDSFITQIASQIPELEKFIKTKNLLTLDPTKPLVVRETPVYMRGGGAGASINAPGPFDKNAKTFYNVTPLDGYTSEEAESYLREYNNFILQILNIHEAIPGHYTQLVYSNKTTDIIKSVFQNNTMIEGWAVYGERMMLEEGYGNNSPEMWLMYYKWHLRSTLNTILDYSIQCLNMSEEDAIKLMTQEGFQTDAEAHGKWKRATLTQTQLCCYFNGYEEIYNLREEYKKTNGASFSLKDFNEKFLSYGSIPVKYIRDLMNRSSKTE
mgnify:CR=1 FL=1